MKTKTRLYLSLGALALLVFLLAIVSIATIWNLRGEGRDLLKANYASIEYMQDLLDEMASKGDTAASNQHLRELMAAQQLNITETREDRATSALAAALSGYMAAPNDTVNEQVLRSSIDSVIDINKQAIIRRVSDTEDRSENALVWISLTATFCALIALSMLFSIPEQLMDPIRRLTAGMDRITQGRYNERVELHRNDEFGHMADRFNAMAAELERWENSNLALVMEEKARAEAVINSLQDASIGLDEQGHVLFANQQALDLLSISAQDIVGKPGAEVARYNDLLRVILTGQRPGPLKIVKDGREQFFTLELVPITRAGVKLGTVVVLRNVTPFEEKDRAKSHFLATISHELKTPLASTDIGLTLLERQRSEHPDPQQMAILADLRKDHQRLVRIVSELLDLTQAESGRINLQPTETPLEPLLQEALETVKLAGQQKDLLFAVRPGAQDLRVRADADKAVWVLVNVLSNAVRHSPDRGVVTIEPRVEDGQVCVSVSDQGPGVPPNEREQLFQRFAPGGSTRHGTGLGLSIVREFMQAMGGSIAYEQGTDEGATFVLTFAPA